MAKQRRRKGQRRRRPVTRQPRRHWPWMIGLVILLMGVGTLLWSPWRRQGSVPPGSIIAAEQSPPALPFTLPSASGEQVELATYLGKQPVVLVFYMGDF